MGEVVASGSLLVAIPIALAAGLLSFLSPCVLPLLPGYLGFLGGASGVHGKRRLLISTSLFIAGFTLVFVLMVLLSSAAGVWLKAQQTLILQLAGIAMVVLGFVFIGMFGMTQRTIRPRVSPKTNLIGAPLLGFAFGIGWTPCIGPTLAVVLSLSFTEESVWRGVLLGIAYSIGLGAPFLLVAAGFQWATRSVGFFRRHIRGINIAGGIMLIAIGVAMVTGLWMQWMSALQGVIGGFVPAL